MNIQDLLDIVSYSIASFLLLFLAYVFIMLIYYKYEMTALARALAIPFVIFDAIVNILPMTILFLDEPREWLVTARLKRYKKLTPDDDRMFGFRRKFAWWFCDILNHWDKKPGGHC